MSVLEPTTTPKVETHDPNIEKFENTFKVPVNDKVKLIAIKWTDSDEPQKIVPFVSGITILTMGGEILEIGQGKNDDGLLKVPAGDLSKNKEEMIMLGDEEHIVGFYGYKTDPTKTDKSSYVQSIGFNVWRRTRPKTKPEETSKLDMPLDKDSADTS